MQTDKTKAYNEARETALVDLQILTSDLIALLREADLIRQRVVCSNQDVDPSGIRESSLDSVSRRAQVTIESINTYNKARNER